MDLSSSWRRRREDQQQGNGKWRWDNSYGHGKTWLSQGQASEIFRWFELGMPHLRTQLVLKKLYTMPQQPCLHCYGSETRDASSGRKQQTLKAERLRKYWLRQPSLLPTAQDSDTAQSWSHAGQSHGQDAFPWGLFFPLRRHNPYFLRPLIRLYFTRLFRFLLSLQDFLNNLNNFIKI